MAVEQEQQWFYDLVVRLRDDSLVFGPWLLSPKVLPISSFTSSLQSVAER